MSNPATQFKKGQSGNPGGRKAGIKDRRWEFKTTMQVLQERKINVSEALADIAFDENIDTKTRIMALKELGLRSEPPSKNVNHGITEEASKLAKDLLEQMKSLEIKHNNEY